MKKIFLLIIISLFLSSFFTDTAYASFPGLPDRAVDGTRVDCATWDNTSEQGCLSCGGGRKCAKDGGNSYCCTVIGGDSYCTGKRSGDRCRRDFGEAPVNGVCDSSLRCIANTPTPLPPTPTPVDSCTADKCERLYNNPNDPTRFCFSRFCDASNQCGGRWLPSGTPCGGGKVCHSDGLCETPRSTATPTSQSQQPTPTPVVNSGTLCVEGRVCTDQASNGEIFTGICNSSRKCIEASLSTCQEGNICNGLDPRTGENFRGYCSNNRCVEASLNTCVEGHVCTDVDPRTGEEFRGVCRSNRCVEPNISTPTPRNGGGGGQTAPTRPPSGGGETQPTEPPTASCVAPENLRSSEPQPLSSAPDWSQVILQWDGNADGYEIYTTDNDTVVQQSVTGPAGVSNCTHGTDDFCMTNWDSNRITIWARGDRSYDWKVKAIGSCTSDEASASFTVGSGGGDNTLPELPTLAPGGGGQQPGCGGAVGSTGQCPDGSGAYTCTYSETDGQCYGGTEGSGHNQAGCNWKCGPVTCPTSGGCSAPGSGGTVPGLPPGSGTAPGGGSSGGGSSGGGSSGGSTTDPLNNQCRYDQVSFKLEQDGTNLNLTVRPKSQPEEGMTDYTDEFSIGTDRLDSSKCKDYFKKQDGSRYRECPGIIRAQDAGKQVVWTHTWKKGCVSSGGKIVCSGSPCSATNNRTLEDISCDKSKVHLDPPTIANNKITFRISSDDSSEGTNSINDLFSPLPYANKNDCSGLSSARYLSPPGAGQVCLLKPNSAGTYTWIHEWTKCRGSGTGPNNEGLNCNPTRCSTEPVTFQITSDGTVVNNPTPAPAGSTPPTTAPALPTAIPTPLPTCVPVPTLNPNAGAQAAEIPVPIATPRCRQP